MKRAGGGGGGCGAGASGTGASGSSKRPRSDASAAAAAEEEVLIDLTTDDSPVVVRAPDTTAAATSSASSAAAAAAAAAARPHAREPIEVSDDEEEDDEAEAYGDLFLGQVMSKVVGIQHYTGIVSRGEAVYLVREPQNRYDPNAIRALNVSNEMVGHVPAVLAALLAPIMDAYTARDFRVEGMVPDPDHNIYSMPLVLSLRGSNRAASRVQTLLAQVPRLGKGHKVIAGGTSAGGGAARGKKKAGGGGGVGPSVQDVIAKELERLYASSVAYEHMPEARTPRFLRSRLHAHQAKALHWMLQAERPLNVAQAIAEQREQQQQQQQQQQQLRAAAEAAASSSAEAAAGAGEGKGKKAKVAGGAGANSTTVFFYEERVDPSSGRTVYYNIASNSASTTPPALARGGILADDMGLGKTIEALALIAADVEQQRAAGHTGGKGPQQKQRRPTLVVCPLSVMANWEGQIEEHLKGLEALEKGTEDDDAGTATKEGKAKGKGEAGLRVGVYHGKDRKLQALQSYDIVLTTYQILSRDFRASASSSSSGGKQLTIAHAGKRKGLLAVNWRRVILDEAHHIKNRESFTAQAAFTLEAERRWCLTGTPISNKIEDLYSLVKFLRVDPFSEFSWFQRLIVRPIADRDPVGFQRLQLLVRHHALRRTKDMKVRVRGPDGAMVLRPLVALPPKIAEVVQLELPPEEREAYDALHALARGLFSLASDAQRQGTTSYAHVFSLLTRLRLLCLHPSLVPADLLEKVERLASSTSSSAGAGAAANMDPQAAMAKALTDLGKEGVERLLQALDAKRGESEDCSICLEELGDAGVITRCLHVYHRGCLLHALKSKNPRAATDPRAPAPCPLCRQQVSMGDVLAKEPEQPKVEADEDEADEAGKKRDGDGGVKASAKMQAILARVRAIVGKPRTEGNRLVLFSSFTSFLDLMGAMLSQEGIRHERIDGSTPREKRAQITRAWSASSNEVYDDKEGEEGKEEGEAAVAQVLLVSIKAGGTGLSLTAANHAIIAEPFFNPAVEDQATDRVHRIGQTRPVYIARFIVEDTVEQALLRLQEQKRQLVAASFHKSREELRRLNMQMLRSVFE